MRGSGFQDDLLAAPCDGSSKFNGSLAAFFGRGLPLPIAISTFCALRGLRVWVSILYEFVVRLK